MRAGLFVRKEKARRPATGERRRRTEEAELTDRTSIIDNDLKLVHSLSGDRCDAVDNDLRANIRRQSSLLARVALDRSITLHQLSRRPQEGNEWATEEVRVHIVSEIERFVDRRRERRSSRMQVSGALVCHSRIGPRTSSPGHRRRNLMAVAYPFTPSAYAARHGIAVKSAKRYVEGVCTLVSCARELITRSLCLSPRRAHGLRKGTSIAAPSQTSRGYSWRGPIWTM